MLEIDSRDVTTFSPGQVYNQIADGPFPVAPDDAQRVRDFETMRSGWVPDIPGCMEVVDHYQQPRHIADAARQGVAPQLRLHQQVVATLTPQLVNLTHGAIGVAASQYEAMAEAGFLPLDPDVVQQRTPRTDQQIYIGNTADIYNRFAPLFGPSTGRAIAATSGLGNTRRIPELTMNTDYMISPDGSIAEVPIAVVAAHEAAHNLEGMALLRTEDGTWVNAIGLRLERAPQDEMTVSPNEPVADCLAILAIEGADILPEEETDAAIYYPGAGETYDHGIDHPGSFKKILGAYVDEGADGDVESFLRRKRAAYDVVRTVTNGRY
jgi:hypothetical protein